MSPQFGAPTLKSYPDSTAFNAAFKELLPLIKPSPGIKERAESDLSHMGRMMQARGIDSAKAHDTVMMKIDQNMDEKILYNAYRSQFSAQELQSMVPFFKTPAGKHYLEVESHLVSARNGEIDQYVRSTVQRIVTPMGKPMGKPVETPNGMKPNIPGRPGMPPPPNQAPPTPPAPTKN